MQASPSGQDVDTAMENSDTPCMYIAAIHNKRGDMYVDVYDFINKVFYEEVEVYDESYFTREERQELTNQINELLTKETYTNTYTKNWSTPKQLPAPGSSFNNGVKSPQYDAYGWHITEPFNEYELDDDEYWHKWEKINSIA